jgi:hypothetical protein
MAGLSSLNDELRQVGIDEFAMECVTDCWKNMQPEAFFAKQVFASRAELFDVLERRLGSPLLDGRETLPEAKWLVLFEKAPSSWLDFVRQVFKLVELAIWQCQQDAAHAQSCSAHHEQHGEESSSKTESKSSGKKACKKTRKKKATKTNATDEPCLSQSSPHTAAPKTSLPFVAGQSPPNASCYEPTQFFDIGTPVHCSSPCSLGLEEVESVQPIAQPLDGACSQSPDEPMALYDSSTYTSHGDSAKSSESRLHSLWLDNGQFGSHAAWEWIVFETGSVDSVISQQDVACLRKFATNVTAEVRRTFLEVFVGSPVTRGLRRSRSAP